MMSSKEKSYKRTMIITIVISIIVVIGSVSYAFYQTTINGTINGTIAEWSFKANNQTDSFSLDLGELYPGKNGTYNITLSAEESELDVYYELIFTGADINYFLCWDSSYTKPFYDNDGGYVGRYGVIAKGSSTTIPIYLNWPYSNPYNISGEDLYWERGMPEIKVIARQYTGYSGSIPMNLLGFTNLISYNNLEKRTVLPILSMGDCQQLFDIYGYPYFLGSDCSSDRLNSGKYKFEAINSTSGYITVQL